MKPNLKSISFMSGETILFSFLYITLLVYVINYDLINKIFTDSYFTWEMRYRIIHGVYRDLFSQKSTLIIAVLTGLNMAFFIKNISSGKVRIFSGASMILSLVTGGCAMCGFPILALLGLTGSAVFLSFRGIDYSYLVIALLSASLLSFYFRKEKQACTLVKKKKK